MEQLTSQHKGANRHYHRSLRAKNIKKSVKIDPFCKADFSLLKRKKLIIQASPMADKASDDVPLHFLPWPCPKKSQKSNSDFDYPKTDFVLYVPYANKVDVIRLRNHHFRRLNTSKTSKNGKKGPEYFAVRPKSYDSHLGVQYIRKSELDPRIIQMKHCYADYEKLRKLGFQGHIAPDFYLGFVADYTRFQRVERASGEEVYTCQMEDVGRFTLKDVNCLYFMFKMIMTFHTHFMTTRNLVMAYIKSKDKEKGFRLAKIVPKSTHTIKFFFDLKLDSEKLYHQKRLQAAPEDSREAPNPPNRAENTQDLPPDVIQNLSFSSEKLHGGMEKFFNYSYWGYKTDYKLTPMHLVEDGYLSFFIMDLKRTKYLKMSSISVLEVFRQLGYKTLQQCQHIVLGDSYFSGRLQRFYTVVTIVRGRQEENEEEEEEEEEEEMTENEEMGKDTARISEMMSEGSGENLDVQVMRMMADNSKFILKSKRGNIKRPIYEGMVPMPQNRPRSKSSHESSSRAYTAKKASRKGSAGATGSKTNPSSPEGQSEYSETPKEDENCYSENITDMSDKDEFQVNERRLLVINNVCSARPVVTSSPISNTFKTTHFDHDTICQSWQYRDAIFLRFINEINGSEKIISILKKGLPCLGFNVRAEKLSDRFFVLITDTTVMLVDALKGQVTNYIKYSHLAVLNLSKSVVSGESMLSFLESASCLEVFDLDLENGIWDFKGAFKLADFFYGKTGKEVYQIHKVLGFKKLETGCYQLVLTCEVFNHEKKRTSITEYLVVLQVSGDLGKVKQFRVYESLMTDVRRVEMLMNPGGWVLQGYDDCYITWQIFGEDFNDFEVTQYTHSRPIVQAALSGRRFLLVSKNEDEYYLELFEFKNDFRVGEAEVLRQVVVPGAELVPMNVFSSAERLVFVQECEILGNDENEVLGDSEVVGVVRMFDFEGELRGEVVLAGYEVPETRQIKILANNKIALNLEKTGVEGKETTIVELGEGVKSSGDVSSYFGGSEGVGKVAKVSKFEKAIFDLSDRCQWVGEHGMICQELFVEEDPLDERYYKVFKF